MTTAAERLEEPSPRPSDVPVAAADHRPTDLRPKATWTQSWPVRGQEAVRLVIAYVAVASTGVLVGMLLTDWAAPNALTRFDERAANAFADHRTGFLTDLSPWAAGTADTFVKIGISALIVVFLLWKFRRWDEAMYVALPLVFEAACFITITKIVQRPRPDVERLIESTINSSFPSGHVAAATVYAAVVVVVWRHQRSTFVRALSAAVFVVVLAGVIWARLYQGMHFVTDVVAGVLLGTTSLYVTHRILTGSTRTSLGTLPAGDPHEDTTVAVPRTA